MRKSLYSAWSLKVPLYVERADRRYEKHAKQLKRNGFSDSETWSLDSVICRFISESPENPSAFSGWDEWRNIISKR